MLQGTQFCSILCAVLMLLGANSSEADVSYDFVFESMLYLFFRELTTEKFLDNPLFLKKYVSHFCSVLTFL